MIFTEKQKEILTKIGELKNKLKNTDYLAIKCVEGELSTTDYQPVRLQRRAWRSEINQLENELKGV